jgi:hypothetical protein
LATTQLRAKGKRISTSDVKRRATRIQNEMSSLSTAEIAYAAYIVRLKEGGETLDAIMATFNAAAAGDKAAERELEQKVRETIPDIFIRRASHKNLES